MNTTADPDGPGWYEIRLQGRLHPRWSAHFDGMTLTVAGGTTLLAGAVVDQAALHGLLQQLRDLGVPLISISNVATDGGSSTPTTRTTPTPRIGA